MNKFERIRRKLGLSHHDFAKELGVAYATAQSLCLGTRQLKKMERLGVNPLLEQIAEKHGAKLDEEDLINTAA